MPAVNPTILVWARETAGLVPEEAVRKIGLQAARGVSAVDRLAALEAGVQAPTRPLLLKMAKQYRRPLLVFYMSKPPRRGDRGSDFRTLPEDYSTTENALLDALIRDIAARQSMVRATLEEEDEVRQVTFIGSMNVADGVPAFVASIRQALRIDLGLFRAQATPEASFALLRERTEELGVFVLLMGNLGSHHTTLSVETFRGFALSDKVAPFVVINDQDAKSAWSFSLLHEVTHLFLGQTGISGSGAEASIEQFCNDVAGEFLLPSAELTQLSVRDTTPNETAQQRIQSFARERNVSSSMVAYKLYRTNAISRDKWRYLSDRFREHWLNWRAANREQARAQEGGPNYYVVRRHRLGASLTRLVGRMLTAGALTTTKAGAILGVKPQSVQTLLDDIGQPVGQQAA